RPPASKAGSGTSGSRNGSSHFTKFKNSAAGFLHGTRPFVFGQSHIVSHPRGDLPYRLGSGDPSFEISLEVSARLNNIALDASPLYHSACSRLAGCRSHARRLDDFCLLACVARRIHLGRRSIRHPQLFADRSGRVAPDLVFTRRAVPIFSVDLHGVTNRTLALGPKSRRISLGKYPASPWQCTSRVVHPCAPQSSRRMVSGDNIRVAPGSGRVGRVDFGTEECSDGIFLFADSVDVDRICRC